VSITLFGFLKNIFGGEITGKSFELAFSEVGTVKRGVKVTRQAGNFGTPTK